MLVIKHKIVANQTNKINVLCLSLVVGAFLKLAVLPPINAASVIFPQEHAVNASRYEYSIDPTAMVLFAFGSVVPTATKLPPNFKFKENLTAVTWAHAVNSQDQLTDTLESNVDMIEADIVLGKLNNAGPDIPIMAHPPANTSDLSLSSFIQQIREHNKKRATKKKGIKLDFKSIEVFEGALSLLEYEIPLMPFPVWLNADIVQGPVNATETIPVDPKRFFAGCLQFEQAVFSVGFTTKWSEEYNEGHYTLDQIQAMVTAIKENYVTDYGQCITIPVRAGIAANSITELHEMVEELKETNPVTLTIWSSKNDYVNVSNLRELIYSLGYDRVYLDIPEELLSQLQLKPPEDEDSESGNGGGGRSTLTSLLNVGLLSFGVYLTYWYMKRLN